MSSSDIHYQKELIATRDAGSKWSSRCGMCNITDRTKRASRFVTFPTIQSLERYWAVSARTPKLRRDTRRGRDRTAENTDSSPHAAPWSLQKLPQQCDSSKKRRWNSHLNVDQLTISRLHLLLMMKVCRRKSVVLWKRLLSWHFA